MIMLNQVGYNTKQKKEAVVTFPGAYEVKNAKGETVLNVGTKEGIQDPLCRETLYKLDFSKVTEAGTYKLVSQYGEESYSFVVGEDVYAEVHNAMIKALYFQRCGCALEEKYAGKFKHAACHMDWVCRWEEKGDDKVEKFEACGGWHDAGDYGRYISPAAVTIAHLVYAYEKYPAAFTDTLNIPESGNGVADVLNECRYELEWMLKLQREDGGVYHKLTSQNHVAFIMPEEDLDPFYAFAVSSMAVADFCAVMALCARVYKKVDAEFAKKLEVAAKKAWGWLEANPQFVDFHNPAGSHTGEYGDDSDRDERVWAAVEMFYLAASLGEETAVYQQSALSIMKEGIALVDFGWTDVAGFAPLAVLRDEEKLMGEEVYDICKEAVLVEAERLLALCQENAFAIGMNDQDFVWGSNMVITNRGILWCLAYELTGKEAYLTAIQAHVDYLLGKNITGYSYVTGFGENAYCKPHSRPMHADGIEEAIPGWVSGGANGNPSDPEAMRMIPKGTAPMKCYVDVMESYSTNEMTIYWNSSAVYVTAFLRR